MNVKEISQLLEEATTFELFRLYWAIHRVLYDAQRVEVIKRRLRVGQQISYFDNGDNREIEAIILKLESKRLKVKNVLGRTYDVSYCSINLDNLPSELPVTKKRLTSSNLYVGQMVGFWSEKRNKEIVGTIIRINPKTVTLNCGGDGEWRVGYKALYQIIEGVLSDNAVYLPAHG